MVQKVVSIHFHVFQKLFDAIPTTPPSEGIKRIGI
jgi:hypothetical protein